MTLHCLKMMWHRKGANALVTFEIFLSFLVVFAVIALGVHHWRNYVRPLGFEIEDVWSVRVDQGVGDEMGGADNGELLERILRELEAMEPVAAASLTQFAPYQAGAWTSSQTLPGGGTVRYELEHAEIGLDRVLGLELAAGRWFEPGDEALHWEPVVINERLARSRFGDADPLGQALLDEDEGWRVVGVVSAYRRHGELAPPSAVVVRPAFLGAGEGMTRFRLLVRVRPGTPVAFEEELARDLQRLAPSWSFRITPLVERRESHLQQNLVPLLGAAVVALFLIAMVGLGLLGVVWQNVTRRTREIGLRRAKGATAGDIYRQILTELLVLTTLGVALSALVVVQLPLGGWFGAVEPQVYALAFAISTLLLYALSLVCGLYPARLAARVQPAEALRYE